MGSCQSGSRGGTAAQQVEGRMSPARLMAVIDGGSGSEAALIAALDLGRRFSAQVELLHVDIDAETAVPMVGEGMSGAAVEQLVQSLRAEPGPFVDLAPRFGDTGRLLFPGARLPAPRRHRPARLPQWACLGTIGRNSRLRRPARNDLDQLRETGVRSCEKPHQWHAAGSPALPGPGPTHDVRPAADKENR